eukprot:Rmarinus@m.22934
MAKENSVGAQALGGLMKELNSLMKSPIEGMKIFLNEDNITDIQAEIEGPEGTPFHGGVFKMKLVLGPDFPASPPKGYFVTKIFHPNVSKDGEICVNALKRDWKPSLGLRHVLMVVRCLLIQPNPESALNEEAGKLLLENYSEYARHAKLMTQIHGIKRGVTENNANHPSDASVKKSKSSSSGLKAQKKAPDQKRKSLRRL